MCRVPDISGESRFFLSRNHLFAHQCANRCMPMTEADIIEPRNRTASDSGDVALPLLSLGAKRNAMMNVATNIRMAMMYSAIERLPSLFFPASTHRMAGMFP